MTSNLLFYLIYPAIVAVLASAFSFFGSYRLRENESRKQRNALKEDFVEKILIELGILSAQLTKLADDPTRYNYFSLQNIATTKPILQRIQLLSEDKLSLFSDSEFRSKILGTINDANSVVEEIESKELNPVNTHTEHQNTVKETVSEYKALKIKLLEMGIYLTDDDDPKYLDDSQNTVVGGVERLDEVRKIIQILNSTLKNSEDQLNTINKQITDQRSFLAVKLLNVQSKVKDLVTELNNGVY